MIEDKLEWIETFELMEKGEEIVQSNLTIGKFVTLSKEMFDQFILEINESRLRDGDPTKGINLIIIEGDDESV